MPEVGEIKRSLEVGFQSKTKKCMWVACPKCGKERWVQLYLGKPKNELCKSCGTYKFPILIGQAHPHWKGGRTKTSGGYVEAVVVNDSPYRVMGYIKGGSTIYVLEHRLVMAKHLQRVLKKGEQVHHRNGIRDDNRIENLELADIKSHRELHWKLEKEVKLLRWRVKELEQELARIKEGRLF